MHRFLELSNRLENQLEVCKQENWRPLLVTELKSGYFIEESAVLLENLFYKLCLELSVLQFVECGAHDAYASQKIKKLLPGIHAVAYEANPFVFANFQKQIESSNVKYINSAISNKVGTLSLVLKPKDTKSWSSEGFLELDSDLDPKLKRIKVLTTTLDIEFSKFLQKVSSAIWIDVEGSNKVLVQGSEESLGAAFIDLIFIETQLDRVWKTEFTAEELCSKMDEFGYVPIARDCPGHWGCNVIFVRKARVYECDFLVDSYFDQLGTIRLPFFPRIQLRTRLGQIKRALLRKLPKSLEGRAHKLFAILGSKSSSDNS
jgi:FkbM family methyltransferase